MLQLRLSLGLASRRAFTFTPASLLHTSALLEGNKRTGIPKRKRAPTPLTYERAIYPHGIGSHKSWLSWNTSSFPELSWDHAGRVGVEDMFIRRFLAGTFHQMFVDELIIKRRGNEVHVAGIICLTTPYFTVARRQVYFLVGFAEQMLSYILKCPVALELTTVKKREDVIFRFI